MRKRYRVRLTTTERDFLKGILAHGKAAAHKQRHARILLQTDEQLGPGLTDEAVARAVEVSVPTVQRVRRILVEHGTNTLPNHGSQGTRLRSLGIELNDRLRQPPERGYRSEGTGLFRADCIWRVQYRQEAPLLAEAAMLRR